MFINQGTHKPNPSSLSVTTIEHRIAPASDPSAAPASDFPPKETLCKAEKKARGLPRPDSRVTFPHGLESPPAAFPAHRRRRRRRLFDRFPALAAEPWLPKALARSQPREERTRGVTASSRERSLTLRRTPRADPTRRFLEL